MKLIFRIKKCLFVLTALVAGNVQAAIVDFEEFGSGGSINLGLSPTFAGANTTPGSRQRLEMQNMDLTPFDTFGDVGGITFSGGVLLENPTETGTMFPDVGGVPVGSVFYGTANAPSTGAVPNPLLPQTITIDITEAENVTLIEGILINGLNTESIGLDFLTPYTITYSSNGTELFVDNLDGGLLSNQQDGSALFSFNSMTMGSMLGALITEVEITTPGVEFPGDPSLSEYDFLIDALSFNQPLNPVPIPAALPLFFSALLGGWIFARPRKPSESIC